MPPTRMSHRPSATTVSRRAPAPSPWKRPRTRALLLALMALSCLLGASGCDKAQEAPSLAPGASPEETARAWLMAAVAYPADPDPRAADIQALTASLATKPSWRKLPSYRTFVERLTSKPYIFRSYATGATPHNGYAPAAGFTLNVAYSKADPHGRGWALALNSGGADSPRVVYLTQAADGTWLVDRFDNLYVDIRKPRQSVVDR